MADIEPNATNPVSDAWNTAASHSSHEEAQTAVDRLSDERFPVEHIDIAGSDLRLVEHVTGRMAKGRAAGMGAAGGAWFGLFIGLLVGLFTTGATWFGLILGGLLIGSSAHRLIGSSARRGGRLRVRRPHGDRGRRDFSSTQSPAAARYDVIVRGGHADRARGILQREGLTGTA
jgi:hypothetical protein